MRLFNHTPRKVLFGAVRLQQLNLCFDSETVRLVAVSKWTELPNEKRSS